MFRTGHAILSTVYQIYVFWFHRGIYQLINLACTTALVNKFFLHELVTSCFLIYVSLYHHMSIKILKGLHMNIIHIKKTHTQHANTSAWSHICKANNIMGLSLLCHCCFKGILISSRYYRYIWIINIEHYRHGNSRVHLITLGHLSNRMKKLQRVLGQRFWNEKCLIFVGNFTPWRIFSWLTSLFNDKTFHSRVLWPVCHYTKLDSSEGFHISDCMIIRWRVHISSVVER